MAESFTSYSVDNDRSFRESLKRASEVVQDLRVPFGLILRDFYKSQASIFGLKGPGLYPPFKKSTGEYQDAGAKKGKQFFTDKYSPYQRRKIKKYGFDYPLLVASGSLAASLLGPNNKGSISKITNLSLVFGTSIDYGIYHQSDSPRPKIPLRKFLFIGPEAPRFATSEQMGRLERWNGYINDYISKKMAPSRG